MVAAKRLLASLGSFALIAAMMRGSSRLSRKSQNKPKPLPAAMRPLLPMPHLAGRDRGGPEGVHEKLPHLPRQQGYGRRAAGQESEGGRATPDYLVWAILTGPGYMPEFAPALSNEQIAMIATFVGNSWGNSSGIVTPEDVQASR